VSCRVVSGYLPQRGFEVPTQLSTATNHAVDESE